jgi:glycosyltransferase involved in cell wall biosynthesis
MKRTILLTARLTPTTFQALVKPIADNASVKRIIAVMDKPSKVVEKVEYRQPPQIIRILFGRALAKLFLLIYLAYIEKPDQMHAFNLFPHGINAFITAKIRKMPYSISIIGSKWAIEGGGYQGDNKFLSFGAFPKPWLERFFYYLLRNANLVTVMGHNTQSFLREHGIHHVEAIPIFIDTNRFSRDESVDRDIDAISISNLIYRKRVDLFLQMFAHYQGKSAPTGVILGAGPLREELRRLASDLNIQKQIEFLGYVTDFEQHLQRSKCFIMLSESEGLSISMLSAMASGVVPIVRDIGDLTEAARQGETAFVIPNANPEDAARYFLRLLETPGLWKTMSHAASALIQERYNLKTSTNRWSELFGTYF